MKAKMIQIIEILIKTNEVMTINQIADDIGLSNKTVRNYFQPIEEYLDNYQLVLVKKAGVGVSIKGYKNSKLAMLADINQFKGENKSLSSSERQLYVLNRLLTSDQPIMISTFEDELFISRPSVYKDLQEVRKWLENRDVTLVHEQRKGIHINAGEKRIRRCLFDLLARAEEYHGTPNNADLKCISIKSIVSSQLKFLNQKDIEEIRCLLKKYEKLMGTTFTADGLKKLTAKYCIAVNRMKDGHCVSMRPITVEKLKIMKQYSIMIALTNDLAKVHKLVFSEEEVCYFLGTLLGTSKHYIQPMMEKSDDMKTINSIIVHEIIEITKNSINISHEESFFNGLLYHLNTVANKINYGFDFNNEYLGEIQNRYPESYTIALKSRRLFEMYYNVDIPLDEIGYIALHIASAIERSKKPLKICVIYNKSYSEIKLMLEFLHNRYRQLDIQSAMPVSSFHLSLFQKFDLIISTETLKNVNDNRLIVLPSILLFEDMNAFGLLLDEIYEKQNDKRLRITKSEGSI